MKNLTPEHLRCAAGAGPAVYELEDGRLLIIGKLAGFYPNDEIKPGPSEDGVIIDRALLANVLGQPT